MARIEKITLFARKARRPRLTRRALARFHLLDAIGGGRDVNLRLKPRLGVIRGGDVLLEGLHRSGLDDVDGRATKAAAGHARSDCAWLRRGDFDHEVEFLRANF